MTDIKRVASSIFRLTYVHEHEPVAVTVLGRVIGHYVPVGVAIDDRFIAGLRPGEPASRPGQEPTAESSGSSSDTPGRTEAPDADLGAAAVPPSPPVSRGRQPAAGPGMTQRDRDKVLHRVAGG